jgi:6-pyruvoyltetrahydropterin/6-carboxytetrahydropterin synthase
MSRPHTSLPFEIRVQRTFAASHAIRLHDGSVEKPHTHDWQLTVTIAAARLDALGMVMDFHQLESLVDDALSPVRDGDFNATDDFGTEPGQRNPTAEQIAVWLGRRIAAALPADVTLACVQLVEAPGCQAVWWPT